MQLSDYPDIKHIMDQVYPDIGGAWLRKQFAAPADVKIFVLHHHLLPIPGTGRERSTVMDAGDVLEELVTAGVNIVLSGHIHNAPFYPDGSWIDRLGRTWVFNPGRQIGPNPAFIIIDLEQMSAEWSSLEGHSVRPLQGEATESLTAPAPSAGGA